MALTLGDRNGSPAFSQQGTIDWTRLADSTVSSSLSILCRISAAGLDLMTIQIAQVVCCRFNLTLKAQRRLRDAVSKLQSIPSLQNALYFGVGFKHPIRQMVQTSQGTTCLAICSALSAMSTSTEPAAMIMNELVKLEGAPDEMQPSLLQWEHLVQSCRAALVLSDFECVAGHFVGLFDIQYLLGPTYSHTLPDYENFAKALKAIGKVSTGDLISITIAGDWACGWLAAIAHWHFGLELQIKSKDGEILFTSVGDNKHPQVCVISDRAFLSNVAVTSSTYFVGKMNFHRNSSGVLLSLGRCRWDELIRRSYGALGSKLLNESATLSRLFGSIARVFTAMSQADLQLLRWLCAMPEQIALENQHYRYQSSQWFQKWRGYNDASHGRGFLDTAADYLPELKDLVVETEPYLTTTVIEAVHNVGVAFQNLAAVCSCNQCSASVNISQELYQLDCLCRLAGTIIVLTWCLTQIHSDTDIQPSYAAVANVYNRWTFVTEDANPKTRKLNTIISYLNEDSIIHTTASAVFGGYRDAYEFLEEPMMPAKTCGGVCFCVHTLIDISAVPENLGILHVIPGSIELGSSRSYKKAMDYDAEESHRTYLDLEKCPLSADFYERHDTGSKDLEARLVVKEFLDRLEVGFYFKCSKRDYGYIGPVALANIILQSIGMVSCSGQQCPKIMVNDSMMVARGEGPSDSRKDIRNGKDDLSIVIRPLNQNTLAQYVTIALTPEPHLMRQDGAPYDARYLSTAVLRRNECLSCCICHARSWKKGVCYIVG